MNNLNLDQILTNKKGTRTLALKFEIDQDMSIEQVHEQIKQTIQDKDFDQLFAMFDYFFNIQEQSKI